MTTSPHVLDHGSTRPGRWLRGHRLRFTLWVTLIEGLLVVVHVLRNSLIPALTAAGPILGGLVTGSFIIENIFAIPGIGRYYVTSVQGRDYSTVMGITVLLSILIIVANMFVDIMYGILDPRTRESRT